jgi:hypothetical protein
MLRIQALKHRFSRLAMVIMFLVAVLAVPLSLGTLGLAAFSLSIHFGAWLGGVGDHAGEWVGRAAMLLGTGLALMVTFALVVTIPLLVSIAVGLLVDKARRIQSGSN